MDVRLYLALQRLTLGDPNWSKLVAAMQAKGNHAHPNPSRRNHWRASLDGSIYIFEAEFDSAVVDVPWFINWLGQEFGINPALIGEATGHNQYGRFSTFSYPAAVTNRFRLGVFGFVQGQGWPTWEASHAAVTAYIKANLSAWEPVEPPEVSILGRTVKLYDPSFAPTAAVLRAVAALRVRVAGDPFEVSDGTAM